MRENRFENTLAYMAAGVIGFSILAILVIVLAAFFKFALPGAVMALPLVGLPLGFVLVFVLLIASMIRKSRENR
jgi:uncharacterized membrane protein